MNNPLQAIISFLLIFPIVVFIIVFLISVKISHKKVRAIGNAADVTTILLFFAVPIAIQSLFQIKTSVIIVGIALVTSVILTVIEWKTKTEIELLPLLRKIWRFLFLVLSITYFIVWCVGLVFKIQEYIN